MSVLRLSLLLGSLLFTLEACGAAALPREAVTYNDRGAVLLGAGDLDQAEASFRLALEFHPGFSEPHANLGVVAMGRRDFRAARDHFRTATELNEDFAVAWANWGAAEEHLGEWARAEERYERALSIDPALAFARRNLALLLLRQGRNAEARAELLRLLQVQPTAEARGMLSHAEQRLGLRGAPTRAEPPVSSAVGEEWALSQPE